MDSGPGLVWGEQKQVGGPGDGPVVALVCAWLPKLSSLEGRLRKELGASGATLHPKDGARPEPCLEAPQNPLCFLATMWTLGGPLLWVWLAGWQGSPSIHDKWLGWERQGLQGNPSQGS